ncbi:MAG: tetratricopeptide repeat protein [Treponema sp.]|nr:tetratricopeptide repeat protein [Treponema sp.]
MRNFLSFFIVLLSFFSVLLFSCAGMAASPEEYFNIGMAYYDLGKYEEAEKWLSRARQANKTYAASQYNLGRIAYERQHFTEAAELFEEILKRDPDNILALRAAAYTRIKTGDIDKSQKHYSRVLELIPESSDDGYNHALVLFAMERYEESEEQLNKYPFAIQTNKDMQLLLARSQGKQNKVEAIDNFSKWLAQNNDYKARYEYAGVLEYNALYARAIEEYRKSLSDAPENADNPKKNEIRFALAKTLLTAERESTAGAIEMQGAVDDGYKNAALIEEIIDGGKLSRANSITLRTIVDNLRRAELAEQERKDQAERERLERERGIQEQTEQNTNETAVSETDS